MRLYGMPRARIAPRERAFRVVIASEAKQSSFLRWKGLDCFNLGWGGGGGGGGGSRRENALKLFLRDFAEPLAQIVGVHDRHEFGCGIQV